MPVRPDTGVQIGRTRLYAYDWQPADEWGVEWGLTQLDGWEDGWEGNGALEQRSQADGAWSSPQWATARLVQIGGTIKADSWDAVTAAWQRFLADLPFRSLGEMTVSTGEGTMPELSAMIRQHGKSVLSERLGGYAEFSISVEAPDPRRYATSATTVDLVLPQSTGGLVFPITFPIIFDVVSTVSQATLVNDGNITTFPKLTITGPCPPCRITNLTTSESLRVPDPVEDGQTLVIDVKAGAAINGGQPRQLLGTRWGLAPGVNGVAFAADSYDPAARLSITYRAAWK